MSQSTHLEPDSAEAEGVGQHASEMALDMPGLSVGAEQLARALAWTPGEHASRPFLGRCRNLSSTLKRLLTKLESPAPKTVSDDFRWLYDNIRLLEAELEDARETFKKRRELPHVRAQNGIVIPRVAAVVDTF